MSIKAKKSLGQNFLKDKSIIKAIVAAGDIQPDELIIEIGPGKGALTSELLATGNQVIAVELDDRLIPLLEDKFADKENLSIIHQDALTYEPPTKQKYKVIANIPYYITSPLITHFLLEQHLNNNLPTSIVLLIQKEVAEKICNPERNSVISLSTKLFGTPRLIKKVPAKAFSPAPKVESAVILIDNIKPPATTKPRQLIRLIKMCFASPRKKIHNNLKNALGCDSQEAKDVLAQANISADIRPENLKVTDWLKLEQIIYP